MCKWLLNGDNDGVAMTLTTAHHFAGNIMYPRQGYREMGVEGWGNFLGTGSSKMLATAVIVIWEV